MSRKPVSSSLDEVLMRELRVYCAERDYAINEVMEDAIRLWLAIGKDKTWKEIADLLPLGSEKSFELNEYSVERQHQGEK